MIVHRMCYDAHLVVETAHTSGIRMFIKRLDLDKKKGNSEILKINCLEKKLGLFSKRYFSSNK